jgi:hypothetical protein
LGQIDQPHDHQDDLCQAFSFFCHIDLIGGNFVASVAAALRRSDPSLRLADDPLRTNGRFNP